LKIFKTPTF